MAPPSSVGPKKPEIDAGGEFLLYAVGKYISCAARSLEEIHQALTIRASDHYLKAVLILSTVICFA